VTVINWRAARHTDLHRRDARRANDLSDSGQTVVAGFSTHPHWDHLLWHARLGAAPRYGTARCAATARDRLSDGLDSRRLGIPERHTHLTREPGETHDSPWLPGLGGQARLWA
jgi:hypothetical protein